MRNVLIFLCLMPFFHGVRKADYFSIKYYGFQDKSYPTIVVARDSVDLIKNNDDWYMFYLINDVYYDKLKGVILQSEKDTASDGSYAAYFEVTIDENDNKKIYYFNLTRARRLFGNFIKTIGKNPNHADLAEELGGFYRRVNKGISYKFK